MSQKTNQPQFIPSETKLEICRLRLLHMSTKDIGEKVGCSRQYVARVLNSLAPGPEEFSECPYPALRHWARTGTESIEEIAEAIGMEQAEFRAIILTASNCKMPQYVAEKLSAYTGLDAKRIARNERPIRPSQVPPEPKKGAFNRVKYPEITKYLKNHNMTMTTLAQKCGQPYPLVYRAVTTISKKEVAQDPVGLAIANTIGKPVEEVFKR